MTLVLVAVLLVLISPILTIWWIAKGQGDKVPVGPRLPNWLRGSIDPLLPPQGRPPIRPAAQRAPPSDPFWEELRHAFDYQDGDSRPWSWLRAAPPKLKEIE